MLFLLFGMRGLNNAKFFTYINCRQRCDCFKYKIIVFCDYYTDYMWFLTMNVHSEWTANSFKICFCYCWFSYCYFAINLIRKHGKSQLIVRQRFYRLFYDLLVCIWSSDNLHGNTIPDRSYVLCVMCGPLKLTKLYRYIQHIPIFSCVKSHSYWEIDISHAHCGF